MNKTLFTVVVLLFVLIILFVLNMVIGSVYIPISALLNLTSIQREIITIIRLPEAIGAIIIGINLAVAGCVMQGVFRNPLAEPYITGTASGAVLGVVVGIYVTFFSSPLAKISIVIQPIFGFFGGMLATLLVILFSKKGGWLTLILAGIAISIFLSALVTIADSYLLARNPSTFSIFLLLFGSLGGLNWTNDLVIIVASIPVLLLIFLSGKKINLLMMGDEVANSTGVNAHKFRIEMLLTSSVLTSLALSFTGIIGFVGLVAPHITRYLIKDVNNARVLPFCALIGAIILLFANFVSKILIPETVVPITAITSLLGAPLLIYFIKKGDMHSS